MDDRQGDHPPIVLPPASFGFLPHPSFPRLSQYARMLVAIILGCLPNRRTDGRTDGRTDQASTPDRTFATAKSPLLWARHPTECRHVQLLPAFGIRSNPRSRQERMSTNPNKRTEDPLMPHSTLCNERTKSAPKTARLRRCEPLSSMNMPWKYGWHSHISEEGTPSTWRIARIGSASAGWSFGIRSVPSDQCSELIIGARYVINEILR